MKQVIGALQVQPEFGRRAEIAAEAERRIGADGARFVGAQDGADPRRRHPQRQRVGGKAERFHELLAENLTGMGVDARHVGPFPDVARYTSTVNAGLGLIVVVWTGHIAFVGGNWPADKGGGEG